LAAVVTAWAGLPDGMRQRIIGLVEGASGGTLENKR
jgi:hypothetical protein